MKYKTAVFMGRFQIPHKAHLEIILKSLKIAEKLIIVIGSCHKPRTVKNPFSGKERSRMIDAMIQWSDNGAAWTDSNGYRVEYIYARDYMYNNSRWASEVYSKCLSRGATNGKDTVLMGCYKDDTSFYLDFFPQWSRELIQPKTNCKKLISSTDLRKELFETGSMKTDFCPPLQNFIKSNLNESLFQEYAFLKEYKKQWESSPFPPTFITTDAVVIKSGHVLMVERGRHPGKGLWALPGGFVGVSDRVQDSCLRELIEETGIEISKKELEKQIKDNKFFDHPNRSLRGRTITHAYLIDLGHGFLPQVKAGDDANKAFWVPLAELSVNSEKIYEDHFDIINNMTSKF